MIIAISRWAGCKPNEHLAWGIALGTWILVISPYRGKSSNTRGNAFALAGRMNPIGHNTTGRCPGLCAAGLTGRFYIGLAYCRNRNQMKLNSPTTEEVMREVINYRLLNNREISSFCFCYIHESEICQMTLYNLRARF